MKKIKRTYTAYQKSLALVWAASFVSVVAGILVFYMPQRKSLTDIQKRYNQSCQKADTVMEALSDNSRTKLKTQTEQAASQLNDLTIPADKVSSLVFEIGRMANQLNLKDFASKNINDQNKKDKAKTSSKTISESWLSAEFRGSYEQFARFVNLLERNSPAIFVEK